MKRLKKIISVLLSAVMILGTGTVTNRMEQPVEAVANKARVSVHDPSIFKDKSGKYYIFGSHIEAARSSDLQSWQRFTNGYTTPNNAIFGDLSQNLKKAFDWAGENLEDCDGGFGVWAPDVVYNPDYVNKDGSKGAYMMYFCTTSTWIRSILCYAVSQNPEGPYEFVDTLIYSGFSPDDRWVTSKDGTKKVNKKYTATNVDELIAEGKVTYNNDWFFSNGEFNNHQFPNAIDPTIYYDTDGRMYMTYGSWSGGIFTLEIDKATGQVIHPNSGKTADGRLVDSYFGTKLAGSYHKSGEGPFIEYNADTGYYYLWETYGGLASEGGYNMRVFRSKNATGPFYDPAGNPAVMNANTNADSVGLKVMGNYKFSSLDKAYMAPGHNSVLCDDDGRWYLINHTRFDDGFEFHEVRVHQMYFNSDGWPVVAPYEYSGDVIAQGGYEEADIVGDYEFINHELDTSGTIHNYVNIKLNANGTISGDAAGNWSQASDSAQASFTIGGQTYNGYFLAQQDETRTEHKVMTFTAVGSNNKTIWGVQTKTYTGTERNAVSFANGSTWRFKNVNSKLYMQVADAKAENGADVQQSGSADGNIHDIWKLISTGDGYYNIVSALGDGGTYALDVAGKKADNGTNITIYKSNGGTNQQFKLTKNADGSYKIRTRVSNNNSAVEIVSGSVADGANVQEWEVNGEKCQDWILEPVADPGCEMDTSVQYGFKNVNSSLVMDIKDGKMEAGSNVQQWDSNEFDCQKWTLEKFSGGGNYYYIHSVSVTDYDYVLKADGTENEGNISIAKYSDDDSSMLFKFSKNPDGTYYIMTKASKDACLVEVTSGGKEMGDNIQQFQPTNHDCQKWAAVTYTTTTDTTTTTTTAASSTTSGGTGTDSTTATTLPVKVSGDVNGDGKINVADVVMLQKWLVKAGDITNPENADMNDDKVLNVFDLILIKRLIIK